MFYDNLRFPPHENKPMPVLTYTLSPEEIEKRYGHLPRFEYNKRRLSREVLLDKLAQGLTCGEIGSLYSLDREMTEWLARRFGVELDKDGRQKGKGKRRRSGTVLAHLMDILPQDEFEDMREQGMTYPEIAERVEVPECRIRYLAREYAV